MLDEFKAAKFELGQFLTATVKWSLPVGYEVWVNDDEDLPGRVSGPNSLAAGRKVRVRFSHIQNNKIIVLAYMDDRNIVDETKAPPKPGARVRWEEHLDDIDKTS